MLKYINLIRNINVIGSKTCTTICNEANKKFAYEISSRKCQTQRLKCWKCGLEKKSMYEIFCANCNYIQEPQNKENYFKVIGIDQKYDLDLKALTKRYRELQSVLHPDKYSNKSDQEKSISDEYSSIVNRAYNILQSPINRGLHLLALNGEKINEDEDKHMDQHFLMEIMELNEEIEEANKPDELLTLNKKNRQVLQQLSEELTVAFDQSNILAAKKILIRMKYYTSISKQINEILRNRGIVE